MVRPQDQVCRTKPPSASAASTPTTTDDQGAVLGRRGTPRQCASRSATRRLHGSRRRCGCSRVGSGSRRVPVGPTSRSSIVAAFRCGATRPGSGRASAVVGAAGTHGPVLPRGPERTGSCTGRRDRRRTRDEAPAPACGGARPAACAVPRGQSGLYFAAAHGARREGRVRAVRPAAARTSAASRVLVVLPTNTWEAYNFRDVDGNGVGDTWYADPRIQRRRPHAAVPRTAASRRTYRGYDRGFLRWLAQTGKRPDVLADDDLERLSGERLARLYDLVVFSGHEEYVTPHVWSAIAGYRDLGGNLAFLSANNFFYRIDRRGHRIDRTGHWSDFGRMDATPDRRRATSAGTTTVSEPALHGHGRPRRAVALRRHGPARRSTVRQLRDRDRRSSRPARRRERSCSRRSRTRSARASRPR